MTTTMDEGAAAGETIPDLKDIEVKIGRKTPEGLLRWMREEASSIRGDAKLVPAAQDAAKDTGRKSLDEKIKKLKMEMAHLRSVDVKILQQLLAVHEGIEAVKWLLEERSTLTSRCSSLTSSQYSLGEGPDTSWRGSWSSLQDPNDRLDNISVGSYLDTLADDMDEYCPSSSESVICSSTPLVSEAGAGNRKVATGAKSGASDAGASIGPGNRAMLNENGNRSEVKTVVNLGIEKPVATKTKTEDSTQDAAVWTKAKDQGKGSPISKAKDQGKGSPVSKANGSPNRQCLGEKPVTGQSPKLKPYKNGKIDTCKMNGKMHLEYDAHWRWVQSQEDVTFL